MSVRKRKWTAGAGPEKEAWVVDYVDLEGKRRLKTFAKKKNAHAYAATASVDLRSGLHVADTASQTVHEAGTVWIVDAERAGLERATVDQYRQHLNFHIKPGVVTGRFKKIATAVSAPLIANFCNKNGQKRT
jgi:hypothetical protein